MIQLAIIIFGLIVWAIISKIPDTPKQSTASSTPRVTDSELLNMAKKEFDGGNVDKAKIHLQTIGVAANLHDDERKKEFKTLMSEIDRKIDERNKTLNVVAEPYSFKEFRLGMLLSEFEKKAPGQTYKNIDETVATRYEDVTIGGVNGSALFTFNDYGKGLQLDCISITIRKSGFERATLAITSKYGPATSSATVPKSNAMGAIFYSVKLTWDNGTAAIIAESIGSEIDKADIHFYHLKLGQSKQEKEDAKKAKKDI